MGLYIAITIQGKHNRSQNLYNNLSAKIEASWQTFGTLSSNLENQNPIPLVTVTKSIKSINQGIIPIKKIFSSFDLKQKVITDIESEIEKFEKLLVDKSTRKNNQLNHSKINTELTTLIENINDFYATALREISESL